MKITIKEDNEKEEIKYPCLMEMGEVIILLYSYRTGVALNDGLNTKMGEYRENWLQDKFKPFNGIITLKND